MLAGRCQRDGETLDQYVQALTIPSKECTFATVSAGVYRKEYIRDTFINGLQSAQIGQHLLENNTLTMDEAAHKHSTSFSSDTTLSVASVSNQSLVSDSHDLTSAATKTEKDQSTYKC